jgi:hypothetical protein
MILVFSLLQGKGFFGSLTVTHRWDEAKLVYKEL